MRDIGHFIGGKEVKGASGRTGDVFDPNTGEVQAKVALAAKSEVEQAIADAGERRPWSIAASTTMPLVLLTSRGRALAERLNPK